MSTDSVRHAVREVFARPEYQWGERSHPLRWLEDWWRKLMSAIGSLDAGHPILARVIFWAAVVALVRFVPIIGELAWLVLSILGLGLALVTKLGSARVATASGAPAPASTVP